MNALLARECRINAVFAHHARMGANLAQGGRVNAIFAHTGRAMSFSPKADSSALPRRFHAEGPRAAKADLSASSCLSDISLT